MRQLISQTAVGPLSSQSLDIIRVHDFTSPVPQLFQYRLHIIGIHSSDGILNDNCPEPKFARINGGKFDTVICSQSRHNDSLNAMGEEYFREGSELGVSIICETLEIVNP